MGVGTTETIDGLIRISNHEQLPAALIPSLDELLLQRTDILEFIHTEIGKSLPKRIQKLLIFQHFYKQVIEIHDAVRLKPFLIALTYRLPFVFLRLDAVFPKGNRKKDISGLLVQMIKFP